MSHASTLACLQAERAAIRALGASCHAPVGVLAQYVAETLQIRGFAGLPDGSQWVLDEHRRAAADRPEAAGRALAERMRRGRRARRAARGRGDGRVSGIVHLVGAGPGDPGLLTVRAVELIAAADVILHDRLIPREALAARPPGRRARLRRQGGRRARRSRRRTRTRSCSSTRAPGARVVRLKGGDPFVFGRGGEEALVLREAGIPFEVVPGITAGIAAPAYAGIPVTQRELASGVAFVTGHEDPAKPESALDWPALAAFPGTLVFYMGVRALPRIAERLVAGGRPPEEPVAVVERGTLPGQRTLLATLADVAERAERGGHPRPGDHARRAGRRAARAARLARGAPAARPHDRRHARPRAGQRARARGCASSAPPSSRRRRSGSSRCRPSRPTSPATTSSPSPRPTARSGCSALLRDARELAGITVAAIGPGTARALRERGVEPDVVPERAVAEGLVEALRDVPVTRALIARAAEGRDVLPDALRERGAEVDVLALYETVAEPLDDATREAAAAADYVLFTSASSVRFFAARRGRRGAARAAAGLDRPRHERGAARARRRAGPRGRPAHARRARRRRAACARARERRT